MHSFSHIFVVQNFWNICGVPADFKVENMYPEKLKEMWLFGEQTHVRNSEQGKLFSSY
jgi:hypothetical protein